MSLYQINNCDVVVSKEKTALIPINFNDFTDAEILISTLKKHHGLLQNSVATMLRCMNATASDNLDLSLKKILSAINDLQVESNKTLPFDPDTEKKLENALASEKQLHEQIEKLNIEIDYLKNEKNSAENKIFELEEKLNNVLSSKDNTESIFDPDSNIPEKMSEEDTKDVSSPENITSAASGEEIEELEDFEDPVLSKENDDSSTNFNSLVHNSKFPREAKAMQSNLSEEAIADLNEKKNLEEMRSKLYGNDDPNAYEQDPQSKKIDEILENALNNLEENDKLDLATILDDNAKDAYLAEALKIYETLDIESYPELYQLDKNSLLQQLERKLSNRRQELRIRRELEASKSREGRKNGVEKSDSKTPIENSSVNALPSSSESSRVFEQDDIKKIDPSQVQKANDLNADTKDDLFKDLSDLSMSSAPQPGISSTTENSNENLDKEDVHPDNESKVLATPAVLKTSLSDTENKAVKSQNMFSDFIDEQNNNSTDNSYNDSSENPEKMESDNDLLQIEVPIEFLTAKEKFQKFLRMKQFIIEITRKEYVDFERQNIKGPVLNAVKFMREHNWIGLQNNLN